jgi:acetyltransferase-like isoleucine patch superfamily enzyme
LTGSTHIEKTADVDVSAHVGDGSYVWHLAQIRDAAIIGADCTIGRGAYIGSGVVVGDSVKIQNHALVYEPARIEDGAFVGPGVVFTNDRQPRAVNPNLTPKDASDWEPVGVTVRRGASIGARAVCVAPVEIGEWAMVAAGSVVTHDVSPFALVAGVPARRIGWVGRAGGRLIPSADGGPLVCPATGEKYTLNDDRLVLEDQ